LLATPGSPSAIARSNSRTVADLEIEWPAVSIVICAYNAAETLDECLRNVALLDYPRLEVIVVDDGSVDETAEIAERQPGVRLIRLQHAGLSEARNVGFREASGEFVAYLDADAYPAAEWVHYLVLGAAGERVVASGGPNVPPPDEPPGARVVAHSPGAPIPVLYRPDRALHLPGCNMVFRRQVLEQLGGFDTDLTSAEDTDLQLRLRQRGLELGYHPAALVWHRRRPGLRRYLRQQRSYGRGQALATVRNPAYFRHYRRRKLYMALGRARTQEPDFLAVSYRSLWWRRRPKLELAHQWGIPTAMALIATAPLGLMRRILIAPAAAGAAWLGLLFGIDVALTIRDLQWHPRRPRTAMQVAALQVLRPAAFVWAMVTEAARLRLRAARLESRSR
jgi:cellulose synthase/poly-beta-1,6-N-acetylglucosamine synthase-like glycosyltransferase